MPPPSKGRPSEIRAPRIRAAAVAGSFYPADPGELRFQLDRMLAQARLLEPPPGALPKAIIAPHAGYIYSGQIAANFYGRLTPLAGTIRKVVLLGPAHRVAVAGVALPLATAFASPLGLVPLDQDLMARLAALPFVEWNDRAHAQEHSLETQLPFLQEVLGEFQLTPLVIGGASERQMVELLQTAWGGSETLIVVSSDLSHYHDYQTARARDQKTAQTIETLNAGGLDGEGACGCRGVNGLLSLARRHDLRATTIELKNSGDTAGSRDRVVGYGAWVFADNATSQLTADNRTLLLNTAARSIPNGLTKGRRPTVKLGNFEREIECWRACFVSLKKAGKLRGCIGSIEACRALVADVAWNAYGAAFEDPRFEKLGRDEFQHLDLSISVLGAPGELPFRDEAELMAKIRPGIDGVILVHDGQRGLFLPQVWEDLPDPEMFLSHLKTKAGLPQTPLNDTVTALRFSAENFGAPVASLDI